MTTSHTPLAPFIIPNTPLHLAAYFGDHTRTAFLLAQGADIEAVATNNHTALHVATQCDQQAVMNVLLAHHANPNARDTSGFTPLHHAAQEGHYRAVHILAVGGGANVDARNYGGETPLHCAVMADNARVQGALRVVRLLLANGADKSAKEGRGYVAAELAVGPDREQIRALLQ